MSRRAGEPKWGAVMNREQFTFYRSFWDALRVLPKKEQLSFALALCAYALDGEELPLSGAAAASFVLAKPVLDTARRKAEGGKQGGSKPKAARKQAQTNRKQTQASRKQTQANRKQTGREKEGEKEKEIEGEIENECYHIPPSPSDDGEDAPPPEEAPPPGEAPLPGASSPPDGVPQPEGGVVVVASVAGVVAGAVGELSPKARAELEDFVRDMGEACIHRALDAARDAGKLNWGYVRGILRRKLGQGVRNAQDWDRWEASHAIGTSHTWGRQGGGQAIAGTPRCVQPDLQRVNRNSQWLADFLSEEERKA